MRFRKRGAPVTARTQREMAATRVILATYEALRQEEERRFEGARQRAGRCESGLVLPAFAFEENGRLRTSEMLAAMPWSDELKLAEARRCRDLWDGFRTGLRPVEDDTPRGFHWG